MKQISQKVLYRCIAQLVLLLLIFTNLTQAQTIETAISWGKHNQAASARGRSEPQKQLNISSLPGVAGEQNEKQPFLPTSTCVNMKLLWAVSDVDDPAFRAAISAVTGGAVDYFDARYATPTLSQMQNYDAVFSFADYPYSSSTTFGNTLATYVDGGGIVIMGAFTTMQPWALGGAIMTPAYSPVTNPTNSNSYAQSSYSSNGTGPLYTGVTTLTGSYHDNVILQGSGIANGTYTDGAILGAYRPDYKVIYLGGAIEPAVDMSMTGDWARLIANAMLLGCPGTCTNPTSGGIVVSDQSICTGSPAAAFTSTTDPSGSSGTLEYKWQVSTTGSSSGFTDIPSSNSKTYSPGTPLQTSWYKRIARVTCEPDWTGAAESNVIQVTLNPLPVPGISGPTLICLNSPGNVYTTAAGMNGYTWVVNGGTITSGAGTNSVTVTWTVAGFKTISVNYNNGAGCTAAAPTVFNVIVLSLPIPAISGPANICAGSTGNVYTTDAGMSGYVWTVSAGGTITAGAGTNAITVTWNTAGAQNVTVTYTNAFGCTAAAPTVFNVTVNPRPVPTITGPSSVCVTSAGNAYTTQAGMSGYLWSVSPGGTITAGAGTNAITVTWNTAGAQTINVNYTNGNGCTAAAPTVFNATVNPLPVPTITGPASVCATSTGNVYTTQAGMTGYNWSVSAGGTITAGGTATSNTVTVTWNTTGAQTVSVNYTNGNGCTAAAPNVYNVTVNPLPVPTITGPASVCINVTGNTYSTQAGMTGYAWSVSPGGIITAGGTSIDNTITVTWNIAGQQTVSVNYLNANGCTAAAPVVYPVTVTALPAPTITGPAGACLNQPGNVYTTQAGKSNYTWIVSPGGTITAGGGLSDNTITITWNLAGSRNVSVNYSVGSGCTASAPAYFIVTVSPRPVITLTGPNPGCAGITGNVYSTEPGMSGYAWSVSAGGTITAGGTATSSTATVTWNTTGAQTVSVNYNNANGCSALVPAVYNVTVNALPAPTITGPSSACTGAGNVYTTQAGMTGYAWSVSAGGTITAGGTATSNTATVTWNTTGAKTVSVNYTNAGGCAAAAPVVFNVSVNPVPVPTIQGQASMCFNSGYYNYITEPNMQNYVWTVSPGGMITYGSGTNQVQVSWIGAGAQTVSVTYANAAGCNPVAPAVFNVMVNPVPDAAGYVTGTANVSAGANGVSYSVAPVPNATMYVWTLPNGATIASGAGTNSITVNFGPNAASGVIYVYGNNICGNGLTSPPFSVTVGTLPGASGTISGSHNVCAGSSGIAYSVATIPGANGYNWTVPAGATIV